MKTSLLRKALMLDAAVLVLVGACLIVAPRQVSAFFHFNHVPEPMSYLLGLWGCGLFTLGVAYAVASTNPWRHRLWVQVGIARGALETIFGIAYLAMDVVTFAQAGFGTIAAALMTIAYIVFYPRPPMAEPVPKA